MPFLALHDGTEAIPNQVQKGDLLECPKCGDKLKIRDSHGRKGSFVARHFYHAAEEETDCGGESPPHLWMKSIAYSKLTTEYPDATIGLEQQLGDRRADVLVEFPQHRFPEGRGIGVEVQHKHEDKDVSLVIENSDEEHPTLIVHVDRWDAESLADRIDEFLREHGARTERERHSATDVRVLATVD